MLDETERITGYINAGGRGTRLSGLFEPDPETGVAKAMLEIGDPPLRLVDHHIANFQDQGVECVVVAAGDQGEVYEYINDTYADNEGVQTTRSQHQLGTGGDLVEYARNIDVPQNILAQNVDTIIDISLGELSKTYMTAKKAGSLACIALTTSNGVPNEGAFKVGEKGVVECSAEFCLSTEMTSTEPSAYYGSSTGVVILEAGFLRNQIWQPPDGQLSLYKEVLRSAWRLQGLFAYNNGKRFFRDVGTIASWTSSQRDSELQALLRYNSTDQLIGSEEGMQDEN